MHTFKDYYMNQVTLSFAEEPFSKHPKHVFVICTYQGKWLLTKHSDRGLEFPGGKVEVGESADIAAEREVKEETGGYVKTLTYIGQYKVCGKHETIIKNIYMADVDRLEKQETYYETDGPVLKETLSSNIQHDPSYSFIMKDEILPYTLEYIKGIDK